MVPNDERVKEEAEWWEPEPVFKMHQYVTLEDGWRLTIFRKYIRTSYAAMLAKC